jgi:hypothetical protein
MSTRTGKSRATKTGAGPGKVKQTRPAIDSLADRLANLRSVLRQGNSELSEARREYDATLVQYLRSKFSA